jgi:hypothetical protein
MKNSENISRRRFLDSTGKAAFAMSCCVLCPRATTAAPSQEGGKIEIKLVAPCGIYCGACEGVVAGLHGKDPKELSCCGCLSAKVNDWVRNKCKVRPCVMQRNLESCALCQQYPCDKLREVLSWAKEAGNNLKIIREKGLEEFKKNQKAGWSCRNCGAAFSHKDKQCRKCAKPVQPGRFP